MSTQSSASYSELVENYLRLAIRFDKHLCGFVDAAFGRAAYWRKALEAEPALPLSELHQQATMLLSALSGEQSERAQYLWQQTQAIKTMIEKKQGITFPFREEARLCLGITHIAWQEESEISKHLERLSQLLPASGSLSERFVKWRQRFELKGEAIERFIRVALDEAKARAHQLFPLPENTIEVRLVHNKPWAGYHWYQGGFHSIYELNIDVPTTIWNLLHTTTHEAFCGHHTEAIVKEAELVNACGYDEFSISLLGTPASLLSEGLAEAAELLIIGGLSDTIEWLRAHKDLHHCTLTDEDAEILAVLEGLGRKATVNAALLMHEQHYSDDAVFLYLRRFSPSEDELLHRIIARLRDPDYRTYMLTYPIGKELVLQRLQQSSNPTQTFYEMLKAVYCPLS
ncbi:MAG: hypothetical protein RMI34_01060 [Chloroherpetonaceae bacterium]|nr:DUF885 domain-containing protein [Chloroherpetonaceae bacterium]MCS7211712.1 DUF885 domain-containing protein [Chloroherpetonaceae bacterium]MDW8018650.1 hypothetical protein [Chloroherpetonaceae bacterium]MDW8465397.1 hypothetical protein [Chloroherpetonaceae bacterium]